MVNFTLLKKNPNQRIGVFVDVQNMYYSAKNLYGQRVNFSRILEVATGGRQMIRALAYVIRASMPEEQTFFDALEKAGFEVKMKDVQIFAGGVRKGDWDVGIAIDMIRLAPRLDVLVLVSGDGDYISLVEYLQNQGYRVESVSFGKSTSGKLIEVVDEFVDMDEGHNQFLLPLKREQRKRSFQPKQDPSSTPIVPEL
ncbi:MAG: hypothetical protein A3F35_00300 [Candidatus Woykebacteria bacterium RIFCSPHIGHO2_12_FULL_45_10]|uniref:NYN domain-containing protein n=1 Tax=Candidatus Woykebacteria bacterium RIFCSPHIGHO2_12_FULL_45_10 TaxID=1802603 RepID=A0A1G1WPT8_9BACT|nr:MAG: hypothetical protein A3F35_00300 [Candidatus Woykebacteria bacterium RIFCSPHIGHO2_12_FULL_45_10]